MKNSHQTAISTGLAPCGNRSRFISTWTRILPLLAAVQVLGYTSFRIMAHDAGLSSLAVTVDEQSATLVMIIAEDDLQSVTQDLDKLARSAIVIAADNTLLKQESFNSLVRHGELWLKWSFSLQDNRRKSIKLESLILKHLPRGHRQVLTVNETSNIPLFKRILDRKRPRAVFRSR